MEVLAIQLVTRGRFYYCGCHSRLDPCPACRGAGIASVDHDGQFAIYANALNIISADGYKLSPGQQAIIMWHMERILPYWKLYYDVTRDGLLARTPNGFEWVPIPTKWTECPAGDSEPI